MALFVLGRTIMNVSRFEFEATPPADGEPPREGKDAAPATIRAAPSCDEDEQSDDEPAEEPGYGHGV